MIILPSQKQPQSQPIPQSQESFLSFIPAGILRSIAEYLVAIIPGALLLFAFFVAAEMGMVVIGGDILAASFIPVICVTPVLSGVVSTLVLEKLRKKPINFKRGAMVGATAAFTGSFFSVLLLLAVSLFAHKAPFGSLLSGAILYASFFAVVLVDTMLGALGGALVANFIKDT